MKILQKYWKTALIILFAAVVLFSAWMAFGYTPAAAAVGTDEFNGGLESPDGSALPEEWFFREQSTVSVDMAEYVEGYNSLHVIRDDYSSDFYMRSLNRIPVTGNEDYRFSYWIRSVNCNYASAIIKATVYNESGSVLDEQQSGETILNASEEASGWTEIFTTFRMPSNAASASVEITVTKGKAEFWLDRVTARPDYELYEDFSATDSWGVAQGWESTGAVNFMGGQLTLNGIAEASASFDSHGGSVYALSFDYTATSAFRAVVRFYSFGGKVRSELSFDVPASAEGVFSQEFTAEQGAYARLALVTDRAGTVTADNIVVNCTYDPRTQGSGWQGSWVCYPANDIAYGLENTAVPYRYTFELTSSDISSAYLQWTADDSWRFWINGTEVTDDANNGPESWARVSLRDIKELLVEGENTFAFEITNATYYTGLLFDLTVNYTSGRQERFFSSEDVVSVLSASGEWWQPGFDDSGWEKCYVIGLPPVQPWGEVVYVDNSAVADEIEIKEVILPDTIVPGTEAEVRFTLAVPQPLQETDFTIYFWGQFSSDTSTTRVPSARLIQTEGTPVAEWQPGKDYEVAFRFLLPDYIESGRYMIQFDTAQVVITGNSSYIDNKLRGEYFRVDAADLSLTEAEVRREDGKTRLYINGEATAPMIYMREQTTVFKAQYTEGMADADVKLVCLPNSRADDMNRSGSVWTGYGTYNFSVFDDLVYETLEGSPEAYLMINLDSEPPQWWKDANPGEIAVDSRGATSSGGTAYGASYASQKWRDDVTAYFKAFIAHILEQPYAGHIFAVKISAGTTFEWQWWGMSLNSCNDFSAASVNAFRAWLTGKYGTDAALREAWNDSSVTLATAAVPAAEERTPDGSNTLLNKQTQQNVIDFHAFYADAVADSILQYAAAIKEACGGRWIVGTYYGYMTSALTYEANNIVAKDISRLLASDDIDFLCTPMAYDTRMSGMSAGFMTMVDTILNAGKMYFMECDSRTVFFNMVGMEPYLLQEWGKTYTLHDTIELMKRDFAVVLAKGAGLWWYDMYGGWFDDDEIYDLVAVMKQEMDYEIANPAQNVSEVAWVIDEDILSTSVYHFGGTFSPLNSSHYLQKEELAHIGAPYDQLYLCDLEAGTAKDYKVYVISATDLDESEMAALESIKKPGVTILWYGLPGVYAADGTFSADGISAVTGIEVALTYEALTYNVTLGSDLAGTLAEGAEGMLYGDFDLAARNASPMAYVTDEEATALGMLHGTSYTGAAQKVVACAGGSWTSYYSSVSNIPAEVIRNALVASGGHVYCESATDALFISSGYIGISSPYGGERTVTLTEACDVWDVFAGEYVAKNATSFTFEADEDSTRLFKTVPPGTVLFPETPEEPAGGGNVGLIVGLCVGGAVLVVAAVAVVLIVHSRRRA